MYKPEDLNDNFTFRHIKENGTVVVTNNLSYVMAEYSDRTGITKWQRVVTAAKRSKVEDWLLDRYPVVSSARAGGK